MLSGDDFKKFILSEGLAPLPAVEAASAQAGGDNNQLAQILIDNGHITDEAYRRVKSYLLGIPFIDLSKVTVDQEVLRMIPEPVAKKHNIVAFSRSARGLEVAMLDPEDITAIDFIRKSAGLKILPRLTDVPSIKQVLTQYQQSLKDEFSDIITRESSVLHDPGTGSEEELKRLADDLPVVRIVESLLSHAYSQKASDIHIEPYEKELVIRYRIDGILHDTMSLPRQAAAGLVARIKVLSGLRLDEKRLPQDGRFKMELSGDQISFRVSVLPTSFGEKVVMRLLPDTVQGLTLDELGFHGESLERLHRAVKMSTGMILATGPTGSGKTTTLYSLLNILNTPDVNISTIEDPIEYQIPRITQTQVKPDIGFTFASGLRSLVRQDPDIVMVGEIRDRETADLAVNAALTGHLVLSTLHTNSAAGAVPRLLDMKVEPFLLTSTVQAIIGQRLVRRLKANKEAYRLSAKDLDNLSQHIDLARMLEILKRENLIEAKADWPGINFYRPVAAGEDDGYEGRVGIHEVLVMSPAIKELIMQTGVDDAKIEQQAKVEGMLSMIEDGIFKAVQGVTSLEEILRVITE
jgi:type IV pilus assembly protein PilB